MFQQGEYVYYGRTGVCRVEDIRQREDGQAVYVLAPLAQSYSITTPVQGKTFMRPVLKREEAEALIDAIPALTAAPSSNASRALEDEYRARLQSHDCRDLVALTTSIYARKRSALNARRKVSATDEKYLREGEALLFGELSVALGIPVAEVPDYIRKRVRETETAI